MRFCSRQLPLTAGFILFGIPFAAFALAGCGPRSGKAQTSSSDAVPVPITFKFEDVTEKAGIHFVHNNGAFGAKLLPETMGAGVGFLDYDQDLDPDLVVINGRDWTDAEIAAYRNGSGSEQPSSISTETPKRGGTCRLYQNNGDGTFTDVTNGSGIDVPMVGMGVSVGDYDNDGQLDLYVTAVGRNYLFRNIGPGLFAEVSQRAGVRGGGWSAGSAFLDYDRDGRLDLFVCRYVHWSPATDIFATVDGKTKAYIAPEHYAGLTNRLYQNLGGGRFRDVSEQSGILKNKGESDSGIGQLAGKSLGVAIGDYEGNGWPDIAVANDSDRNYLFRNNGNGTFTEVGSAAGIAASSSNTARAADFGDIDGSGHDGLLLGGLSTGMPAIFTNQGGKGFLDALSATDSGTVPSPLFGACFLDADNDGRLDIVTASGHLDADIQKVRSDVKYRQRPQLFQNVGKGDFVEIGTKLGSGFSRPIVGRGIAYADIDLDGDLDIAMTSNGGPLVLFRNDGGSDQDSIRFVLEGARSNRSAIGARVDVRVGSRLVRRRVRSGGSYCSQSEIPLTVGIGRHLQADSVSITWPSGETTQLKNVTAGQAVRIREGLGVSATQPFMRGIQK